MSRGAGKGAPTRVWAWARGLAKRPSLKRKNASFVLYVEGDDVAQPQTVVRSWDATPSSVTEVWVDEVCEVAQADCDSRSVTTVYGLCLRDGQGDTLATTTLRLKPSESALEGIDEPPTMAGIVQQLMRHNEAQARQNSLLMMQSMAALSKQTEALNGILETQTRLLEAATSRAVNAEQRAEDALQRAELVERDDSPMLEKLVEIAERHLLGDGGDDGDA